MREIKALIRPERLSTVLHALHAIPMLPGVTISTVRGFGRRYPARDGETMFDEVAMTKLEIVVPASLALDVVGVIEKTAYTGQAGDGKIFVLPVELALKIRSGDRDEGAR